MSRQFFQKSLQWLNSSQLITSFPFPRYGFSSLAVHLSHEQSSPIASFDSYAYADMLQSCATNGELITGMSLHCDILKRGDCLDLFAWNILLNMYVKLDRLVDACHLLDQRPERNRNMVSYVTMIQGYVRSMQYDEAIELFVRLHKEGHELNPFVFTTILKLVVSMGRADLGWIVHACIHKLGHDSNAFVGTALIDSYAVCRFVDFARDVFDGIMDKDMVPWTGMVGCYADNGCFEEALELFIQMRMVGLMPNNYTLVSVLKACVGLEAVDMGKSIHGCALKTHYEEDLFVGISLLDLYTKSGDIEDARGAFEEIPKKDVIPWSFMIARYSQSDQCEEAIELFCQMRQALVTPNQYTFASVLQACATLESLGVGQQIHGLVLKAGLDLDVFVSNALMGVYAKCGKIDNSLELFLESTNRNEVTWNTLIVGYVQQGDHVKALTLFLNMLKHQAQATDVTYSSILRASASLAALEPGIQIHSLTIKTIYDKDIVVANALIDMYAKCGSIKDARLVFDKISKPDVISWNAMVSAYSMHGLSDEALRIFEYMQKLEVKPNNLTFVGVLSACSNMGLLDQGEAYFTSMVKDHGIEPSIEHYTCMVSLLGRLGHVDRAMNLIMGIPFEPSVMVWRALLGACVMHNDIELGRISAERVLEIDPKDESTYVLLSNMYATARRWDNLAAVRKKMKKNKVKKQPGLSWIENEGTVHYFKVGDVENPDLRLIHGMLEWLNSRTKKAGYVPNCSVVLLNVEEDDKERLLWVHSERLALAFGLIRTPPTSPIRIIKNLRICADCHAVMKIISEVVRREIIIRDINRFHSFHDGVCSCGDYW